MSSKSARIRLKMAAAQTIRLFLVGIFEFHCSELDQCVQFTLSPPDHGKWQIQNDRHSEINGLLL